MTIIKKYAGEVVSIGLAVAAILTIAINLSTSLHIPAGTVAILSAVAGVVGVIVDEARQVAANKMGFGK